jgi:hypothetical protein
VTNAAYASNTCNVSSEDPRLEPVEEDQEPSARADLKQGRRGKEGVKMKMHERLCRECGGEVNVQAGRRRCGFQVALPL